MKYVRTKDGIYEVKNEEILCGVHFYDIERGEFLNRIREDFIIKESDTIEELCDEFVYEYDTDFKHERCQKDYDGRWVDYETWVTLTEKQVYTIKGAIWTDEGLIYVAKAGDINGGKQC